MVKNQPVCKACGYTSNPVGARFCSSCGTKLSLESEDIATMENPTATAVPISEASPAAEDTARGEAQADAIPRAIETNPARFYKNPSDEMLKSAPGHHTHCGLLFINTPTTFNSGKVTVPRVIDVFSILDGAKIDLSVADFIHPATKVRVVPSIMSGLKITVPQGVRVEVKGLAILGGMEGPKRQNIDVSQDAPLLLVKGLTLMGGVKVLVNERVPPIQVVH
ncbi:unnamed protein product [Cylindrotheca closterium]|uniref:Uncharacterized protein n=1 Tax=Cylindrotheca closterium TaxID=2856 RepID=A0AAD2FGW6_9STRA|nr:unnamed protein product [Cylindrotheca closterium]